MKTKYETLHVAASVVAVTLVGAGPALAYFELAPPLTGFLLFSMGSMASVPLFLIGLWALVRRGPVNVKRAGFIVAIPAVYLVYSIYSHREYPPINDIATVAVFPPLFAYASSLEENSGRDYRFPEENADVIAKAYPEVQPLAFQDESAASVFERVKSLAEEMAAWTVVDVREEGVELSLEGYATTSIFKFRDDWVVRVAEAGEGACVVDMRSKSRDGLGDLGANARRIREFLAQVAK